jgi:dCTP deaminase
MGLMVHVTAGFIDPGFKGNITLEFKNLSDRLIQIDEGMPICQICFETIEGKVLRPYGSDGLGSKYQGSKGTRPANPRD